ncbi:L-aspartate oxidase [Merismopedia glauca]|uniref:L-aspartate oxidase n=1 Tax=Merismopedia glauca TaxID=292586 RepID=UPI0015E6F333|nr:L-aspartate oxidase [Merismopedia glauca]
MNPDSQALFSSKIPAELDVLVVGAGAAGLYATLCIPDTWRVGLLSKDTLQVSASDWAQGGIAAAVDPNDSPELHFADTLRAGAGLCEPEAVQFLVDNAATCIKSLVNMGVGFDRSGDKLALTLEAAHSRPRVLHAADTTGRAMVSTLTEQVLGRENIEVFAPALALSLWLHPETHRCQGASVLYQGEITWIRAKVVVLATGGGGQVYAQTTNPAVSTGDGVAIAYRAGALLRDLEFFQFHPTALTYPGAPRFLISEAVRGEGAHLVDSQGKRFVFDYHPAGELAPRDVVSRAIFSHLQKTATDIATANVWLDLRPIPPDKIRQRFPNIIRVCQHWGIDILTEPIPVAPAAHYWMGGIVTDLMNHTSISRLYAIGETASTGVHGANRLASNSLLECIVFGARLSQIELPDFDPVSNLQVETVSLEIPIEVQDKISVLRQQIPRLMWQSAGISREKEVLDQAIAQVEIWQSEFEQLPLTQKLQAIAPGTNIKLTALEDEPALRNWAETYNLLTIAQLILKSAEFRIESRGGHYRSDFPQVQSEWEVHTLVEKGEWSRSSRGK